MSSASDGLLLLDKPIGLSSNAALQRVRRLGGGIKAGHTGSLDPLASGMLPICLGEATKLAGEMLLLRKCYAFGIQLGERSETGDAEGAIVERSPVPTLSPEVLDRALKGFLGSQQQVPPMYSALKRQGQPLYKLARQGLTVEREARQVSIDSLELLGLEPERLQLRVLCSKGTYIRVLAEDLARALGTCGRLYELRREYVEPFANEAMISLEELQALSQTGCAWPLLQPERAVGHLPSLQLDDAAVRALRFGQTVSGLTNHAALWRLYDPQERFLGLGESDAQILRVRRLFFAAQH